MENAPKANRNEEGNIHDRAHAKNSPSVQNKETAQLRVRAAKDACNSCDPPPGKHGLLR